jgi:CheY-like chemotaxis protein
VGLVVDTAENGRIAVEMAAESHYDLILMDIQMPEVDGLEATRLIRSPAGSRAANKDTPILALTANVFKEDRLVCLDAGIEDFIGKPVEPADLFSTIIRWLPDPLKPPADPAPKAEPASKEVLIEAAPEREAAGSPPGMALDPWALDHIFADDHGAQRELLKKFVAQMDDVLLHIETAYRERDSEKIRFHSHKLKSSARMVGANLLADLCLALETAAHDTNWAQIDSAAAELGPAADSVKIYVKDF